SKKPTQVGFFTSAVYESKFSQHDEANTDKPVQQCAVFCVSKDGHFVSAGKRVGFQRQRHPALSSG
ncbi:TPA: hypothetical protein ACGR4L_004400, partial [Serratia marcescens]